MHFHHRDHAAGCTSDHDDWPDWATTLLATLDRKADQLMAAQQAELDAATTVINALVAKVGDLQAQIAAQSPVLDATGLDAAVTAADAVLNPQPAPAAPADAPQPDPAPEQPAPGAPPAVASVPLA